MNPYQTIVCGGGPSGITAALASARNGAQTLLIEQCAFSGGSSTNALVYPWMSFHDSRGNQVVGGIGQQIVSALVERGGSPGHVRDTIGFVSTVTPFDAEIYKRLIDELLAEAGVDVLYHTRLIGAEVEGDQVRSIQVANPSGITTLSAELYIDSTGNGDLAWLAGNPFYMGRKTDGLTQPMTMNFVLGGVDLDEVRSYLVAHPDEFFSGSLISELDRIPLTGVSGFFRHWAEHGPKSIPRDRLLFFVGLNPGEVSVNTTRVIKRSGTDARDLTSAEREGRRQVAELIEFVREYIPGFSCSFLSHTAPGIGVRETRRMSGRYVLSSADIVRSRPFADRIAHSGYPLDLHDPTGNTLAYQEIQNGLAYDIPYRCLLPMKIKNLLLNGRCISVTHTAFSSTRVTPSCMAIGQAAGTAAALSVREKKSPADLDVRKLQDRLVRQDAVLRP